MAGVAEGRSWRLSTLAPKRRRTVRHPPAVRHLRFCRGFLPVLALEAVAPRRPGHDLLGLSTASRLLPRFASTLSFSRRSEMPVPNYNLGYEECGASPMRLALVLVLTMGIGVIGCGGTDRTVRVNGLSVSARGWNHAREDVGRQAAYESECNFYVLEYTLLQVHRRQPVVVGVSGCEWQGVYRYSDRSWTLVSSGGRDETR